MLILRRLLWLIPVVLIVAGVTFILMHLAPGNPWSRDPSRRQVDAKTQQRLNEFYGLDRPWLEQFTVYVIGARNAQGGFICGMLCGNLGPSYRQRGLNVQDILFNPPAGQPFWQSKFGYSARLGLLALALAVLVGLPLGILSALRQNSWVDVLCSTLVTVGISVPGFVLAICALIFFGSWLNWIPIIVDQWDSPGLWLVPAVVLAAGPTAQIARLMRASLLDVMHQDYIRTARAKGLVERLVVMRHMLRNALIPVVTLMGPSLAGLLVGSFVVEQVFAFPGMGRAYVVSISGRDYSMIMGTTVFFAVLVVLANLSVDLLYPLLDPRIHQEGGGK